MDIFKNNNINIQASNSPSSKHCLKTDASSESSSRIASILIPSSKTSSSLSSAKIFSNSRYFLLLLLF